MDRGLKEILDELRFRFDLLYGRRLVQMILYGSQARSQADLDSDIDVLVVLKSPVLPCEEIARTEQIVSEVSLAYDVVIACVFVSEEEFEQVRTPFLLNVHREGMAV